MIQDSERYVLVRVADGAFLSKDFVSFTTSRADAHEFINGAALNACWEANGGARGAVVSRFSDGDCKP